MEKEIDYRTPRDRITSEFLGEIMSEEQYEESTPVCSVCNESKSVREKVEITGDYSLAMAYVPRQVFRELYTVERALCEGTVFSELRFPFYQSGCIGEAL